MYKLTPLKNMSSSIGMMNFPTEWKNNKHVPHHSHLAGERRESSQTIQSTIADEFLPNLFPIQWFVSLTKVNINTWYPNR